jgi:3-isopropylmalate dehydrogenase
MESAAQTGAERSKQVVLIGGDGIGPDVLAEAALVLEGLRERGLPVEIRALDLGAERYLRDGTTLPEQTLQMIRTDCDAVLLGAFGDPRVPSFAHAEAILLGLRQKLDLYANIRPARALCDRLVPLKNTSRGAVNLVVFRENTEGLYAGIGGFLKRGTHEEVAVNEDINTASGVERILVAAFEEARRRPRRRLHMADKSNALRCAHDLWQRVFRAVRERYPDVDAHHLYVDALCLALVRDPSEFDVIVTNNLFGDIVSDLASGLIGGLGLSPSANVHASDPRRVAVFEPVHGSAPGLAGKDLANPFAAILSLAWMLGYLGFTHEQRAISDAVADALERGDCTADVGGRLGTREAGRAVRRRLGLP